MLILQVVLIGLLVFHEVSAGFKIDVKVYKWNETIQMCSPDFNILADVICTNDRQRSDRSMIIRNKRGSKTRLNLYLDCCKSTCTPYDILTKYCQHPERMDVKKDLKVYTMIDNPKTTTSTPQATASFSMSKLMYCFMGMVQHCDQGINQQVGKIIGHIGILG